MSSGAKLLDDVEILMSPSAIRERLHGRIGDACLTSELGQADVVGDGAYVVDGVGNLGHGPRYYDVSYGTQEKLRNCVVPPDLAAPHQGNMARNADRRRESFRSWVKENGNVKEVAKRAGVPPTTLYSYLGGKSQSLKGTTQEAVTRAFGVSSEDLFGDKGGVRLVPVVGYVGAGDAAHYYDTSQGDLDYVSAPEEATEATQARIIKGPSIGRRFDGWVIFSGEAHEPPTPDQNAELCVCGLEDGRVLVKWLEPTKTPGIYHLLSETEGPIFDQEVKWAAKVTSMRPK
jgi:hypothetical protein